MKILIIDDSRLLRVMNEKALTRAGYEVIGGIDGEEGLRLAREHKPDLIILDMMLPKLSGPDVLRALQKEPGTASIPVMVLTSLAQSNEGRLIDEGAISYFEKSRLALDKGSDEFLKAVAQTLTKVKRAVAT